MAEKGQCNFEFTFTGDQGHSSAPPKSTSIGKMASFIKDVEEHPREMKLTKPVEEMLKNVSPFKKGIEKLFMKNSRFFFPIMKNIMKKRPQTNALIRTTVAFTVTKGGTGANILPDKSVVNANVRILPGESVDDIKKWFKSFNHEFEMKLIQGEDPTDISDIDNDSYEILKETINEIFDFPVVTPYLMIGATDSRNYKGLSNKIFRFMPCKLTADELALMHADDEYISIENFNKMIDFYKSFIKKIN